MCGIVGYIGKKQAKELLLNCLEKLEYRGYNSAGIAISDGTDLKFSKTKGNISKLRQKCVDEDLNGSTGIAHTRWATHGEPSAINSHPHFNTDKTIAVVHNGNIEKEQLAGIKKIYIVACGSAYHAGLIGKNAIEKLSGIEVEVNYASEFRYKNTTLNKDTLVVTVTQSGETADTLATIPIAKKKGAKTLAITNVAGSSVTREADMVFYTKAGPEIAVASTKAYLTQLTAMYIFAIFLGEITSFTSSAFLNNIKKELSEVVFCIKNTLELNNQIKSTAKEILKKDNIFYLGRGNDYAVAMEGALKLKETAYIHCEAYPGGELKHGPIALIEDGTIVIAINTTKDLQKKTDSNIKEVISRGAKVIGIVPEGYENSYYKAIYIPKTNEILYPLISSIPLQLLAYHISAYKKYDVDKPKNLAKSVTVE